jgi:hypothetical protein
MRFSFLSVYLFLNWFNYEVIKMSKNCAILQCLDLDDLTLNSPTCSRSSPPFNCSLAGHVITGGADIHIVENEDLKSLNLGLSIWWQDFVAIMNAVKHYVKCWTKRENEELDTLSERVKCIRGILKSRIENIKSKVHSLVNQKWLMISKDYIRNMFWFQLIKLVTTLTSSLFVRLTITTIINELGINSTFGNPTLHCSFSLKRWNSSKPEILLDIFRTG